MSVKFSKLQEEDLCVEDSERGDDEIDSILSNSDAENGIVEIVEGNDSDVSTTINRPIWRFWERRYRYNLSTRYLRQKSCRRCTCKVNSWRAVIIALLLFSAAVLISVIISKLATEPPADNITPEPQLNNGVFVMFVVITNWIAPLIIIRWMRVIIALCMMCTLTSTCFQVPWQLMCPSVQRYRLIF